MPRKRAETLEATDPRQLEAVANPRRQDMLARLTASGPLSIRELAEQIGARPTALYHHVERLLEVGLVIPAGSRVRHRRREQLYDTVAQRLRLSKAHRDATHTEAVANIVAAQTRQLARDFRSGQLSPNRVDDGDGRNLTFFRMVGRPSPDQLAKINACLADVTEILWNANDPRAELVVLGCVLAPIGKAPKAKRSA
jgi:DNA-binding transcriptional ArsR family regulator